jgi:hypothetical protein
VVGLPVVDEELLPRAVDWRARYRLDPAAPWAECRLLDITLTGAVIELADELPVGGDAERPFELQIDTIADDEVGITMQAVIHGHGRNDAGQPVVDVEFSARREERLLLHLLVRLHSLV